MQRPVRRVAQHCRHAAMSEDDVGNFLEGGVIPARIWRALLVRHDEHARLRHDAVDVHAHVWRIGLQHFVDSGD